MRILKDLHRLLNSERDCEETVKALALLTTADQVVSEPERKAVGKFLSENFPGQDLEQLYQLHVDRMLDPRVLESEEQNLLANLKGMSSDRRVALAGFLRALADVDGRQPEELPVINAIYNGPQKLDTEFSQRYPLNQGV